MYKCLADDIGSGGIWNHRVSIQYVKQNYQPLLTMKIQLNHNSRNKIKVTAGVSLNSADTKPQYVLDFPIFNFQGGDYFMQGDTIEAAKTIEFGLDVSPLLNYVQPGQNAKYFLQVAEADPSGLYSGQINSFSLIDYTSGTVQVDCPSTNVVLTNNDTTRLSIQRIVNFNKVNIITDSLPEATINEPYSLQLNAASGTTPYHWDFLYDFTTTYGTGVFPAITTQTLVANSAGYAVQNLGFDFPFYNQKFNKLYISPDGYIKFDNQLYNWPYLIDKVVLFKSTKIIAPFFTDLSFAGSDNFWYEGNNQYAIFRWKAYVTGQSGSIVNVAVKLYPSGKIEMYYDNISVPTSTSFISAVTRGDNTNYQFTNFSGKLFTNTTTKVITLTPPPIPWGMNISENGLFYGTPVEECNNVPVPIKVTDNNFIIDKKTLNFTTKGVVATYKVAAGIDSIINAGENVLLSVALKNIGGTIIPNAQMKLSTSDNFIMLVDSTENAGNLAPDDSVIFLNAFSFDVDTNVNDNHIIPFNLMVFNATDTFNISINLPVRSLILELGAITIADGNNNIIEPNETASLIVEIKNIGGATAYNVNAILSTNDAYTTVSSDSANISSITGSNSSNAFFIVHVNNSVPDGHIIVFNVKLTAEGNYVTHKFFAIKIGGNAEDFETGTLTQFPWTSTGDSLWFVTTESPFEGAYCIQSGSVSDNEQSSISVNLNILNSGSMSFYRKVSCEAHAGFTDYDFLAFFIDGVEMERWDGVTAWQRFDYPVTAGPHTFKWMYKKDYSVSVGEDCAWLDNIVFPPSIQLGSNVTQLPNAFVKTMIIDSLAIDSLLLNNNNAGGMLVYSCEITDFSVNGNNTWLTPEVNYSSLDPSSQGTMKLYFSSFGLDADTYNSNIRLTYNFTDTVNIPVTFHVYVPTGITENGTDGNSLQVFPNPFSKQTTFNFTVEKESEILLDILDLNGGVVKRLVEGRLSSGKKTFYWDGSNENRSNLSAGVYYYRFVMNENTTFGRIIYTK
jgi:hypothetical protein